jgi:hypothetical protein
VRGRECGQERKAGICEKGEHPAFTGAFSHGDYESQFRQQPHEAREQGQRGGDVLPGGVRGVPSGWYQGTTFQATSWSRGRPTWSRMRKKFAAVSSLLSTEMNPDPDARYHDENTRKA